MKRILHLSVKGIYFSQIKVGLKLDEYRLKSEYWAKRLINKEYDEIHIKLGYPKKGDRSRILIRPWRGYIETQITHEHFGCDPVDVFAIHVN